MTTRRFRKSQDATACYTKRVLNRADTNRNAMNIRPSVFLDGGTCVIILVIGCLVETNFEASRQALYFCVCDISEPQKHELPKHDLLCLHGSN